MSPSPAPRWFGSFVLAPFVWVLLVMPGPAMLWSNLLTDRFAGYVSMLGLIYGVMLVVQLAVGAVGAAAMRMYFGSGWGSSKIAGVAFLVAFPFASLFFFVFGLMAMDGVNTINQGKSGQRVDVLAEVSFVLTGYPLQALTTLAIAAAFALWITRSSPRA